MKKQRLIAYYNLYKAIEKTEHNIIPSKYLEDWYISFEEIRDSFHSLYKVDEDSEHTLLEWFMRITEDMKEFDFDLLTKSERKECTDKEGSLFIIHSDMKNYPHAIVEFENIEEVADYVLRKDN